MNLAIRIHGREEDLPDYRKGKVIKCNIEKFVPKVAASEHSFFQPRATVNTEHRKDQPCRILSKKDREEMRLPQHFQLEATLTNVSRNSQHFLSQTYPSIVFEGNKITQEKPPSVREDRLR